MRAEAALGKTGPTAEIWESHRLRGGERQMQTSGALKNRNLGLSCSVHCLWHGNKEKGKTWQEGKM